MVDANFPFWSPTKNDQYKSSLKKFEKTEITLLHLLGEFMDRILTSEMS